MNWIIQHTEKLKFHTNLKEILKPILADIKSLNLKNETLSKNSNNILMRPFL